MDKYLKDVAKVIIGIPAPKEFINKNETNAIPFIRVSSLEDLCNDMETINEFLDKTKFKVFPKGTVVFAKSGMSVLKNRVYSLRTDSVLVSHLAGVVCDENEIYYKYLEYFLKKNPPSQLIQNKAYPSIRSEDIERIHFVLPKLEIQKKIVEKLEIIQDAIKQRKKQIEELQNIIKSQFVEMFTNFRNKEKIESLSNYFSRGKSPNYVNNSKIGVINQACIYWNCFKMENIKYQDESRINNAFAKMIRKNDVLITSTGTGTLGRCNVYGGGDNKYIADGHVSILRLKEEIVNPVYFKYYFMQDKVQKQLYSECVNGSTNQIELSKDKFLHFDVSVPPIELQNKFADFVQQVDKQKFEIENSLKEIQELYESLMEQYFS